MLTAHFRKLSTPSRKDKMLVRVWFSRKLFRHCKVHQLIKFLTFRSVHFHPTPFTSPSFPIVRGSGSETKVTEGVSEQGGVSRHTADFLLFMDQQLTNKTTATESTKVGYVYGLTTTWTSCRSFAEKQKVGGVSGNPGNPLRYLTHCVPRHIVPVEHAQDPPSFS